MILAHEYCLPLHKFAKDKSQSKSLKGYTLQTTNPKPPSANDLRRAVRFFNCFLEHPRFLQ